MILIGPASRGTMAAPCAWNVLHYLPSIGNAEDGASHKDPVARTPGFEASSINPVQGVELAPYRR